MTLVVSDWIKYAESDLRVAEHLFNDLYPKELEIICYHCQQSAEKAVKALIIYYGYGETMPKVHDIVFLLDQIKNKTNISEQIYDCANDLSKYSTVSRYPNEMVSDEYQTKKALEQAKMILAWAKELIKDN